MCVKPRYQYSTMPRQVTGKIIVAQFFVGSRGTVGLVQLVVGYVPALALYKCISLFMSTYVPGLFL